MLTITIHTNDFLRFSQLKFWHLDPSVFVRCFTYLLIKAEYDVGIVYLLINSVFFLR